MVRLLTMVTSCYPHRHMWPTILKKNADAIIICGSSLDGDYTLEERILYLNCDDTYGGLPEKILCALDAILQIKAFDEFTHVFKCDDTDMIECTKTFTAEHLEIISRNDYVGQTVNSIEGYGPEPDSGWLRYHYGKVSLYSKWFNRPYTDKWVDYAAGPAYVLSREAMRLINRTYSAKDKEVISDNYIYEDLMIGQILLRHSIRPVKIPTVLVEERPAKKICKIR